MKDDRVANTLGALYEEHGHVYVTTQGYVHMHFYVSDETVALYIGNRLSGRVVQHKQIYDVVVSDRVALGKACQRLLEYSLMPEERRRVLLRARGYAKCKDARERHSLASSLRELLVAARLKKLDSSLAR